MNEIIRTRYPVPVPWTDETPTEPGAHRCRFKAGDGIDQTPFEVELYD